MLPTAYVVPTSYSSYSPTSYSSYSPTSYSSYSPTSYLPTSAVMASDSVVYPTSTTVVRRSIFRPRRYVERTYYSYPLTATSYAPLTATSYALPTTYLSSSSLVPTTYLGRSYVAPTSYLLDDSVVATSASSSSYPCETSSPAPVATATGRPMLGGGEGGTITSKPSVDRMDERRPQGSVNNASAADEAPSSAVNPTAVPKDIPPPAPGKLDSPPTVAPLDEPKPEDIKVPAAGESGKAQTRPNETSYRQARRPSYDVRNILRGGSISEKSRQPEEGVTVIVSSLTRAFGDRPTMTNAFGEFNVSLPDGDWTVKVKMPSGSVYAVGSDVTASAGRVIDPNGRNVAEFLITR